MQNPSASGFELRPRESLAEGLKRITVDQLQWAAAVFYDESIDVGDAVHESRKAMKKVRSLLRMVRPELGKRVYAFENKTLRDAARRLSPMRGARVAVRTVRSMRDRFEGSLREGSFLEMEHRLEERERRVTERAIHQERAVEIVVSTLHRARNRYSAWPTEPGEATAYRSRAVIGSDFKAIGPGIAATYSRGQTEMSIAYRKGDARQFHGWRKRAKYLRHQMEVLVPIWPEVMGGLVASLDRLSEILGEEHDLAELLGLLMVRPEVCSDPVERSLFAALAQHRRSELQAAARVLGNRVYAEPAPAFRKRLGAYWSSAAFELPLGVAVLEVR